MYLVLSLRLSLLLLLLTAACDSQLRSWVSPTVPFQAKSADDACDVSASLDFSIEGFGAETVGGWQEGTEVYCVTQLDDDGPGSLRDACRTLGTPRIIGFGVDGVIDLDSPIELASNLSIDGRGRDVAVRGKGFVLHGVDNVILTDLTILDVFPDSQDAIQIGNPETVPSSNIVFDHLSFIQNGDLGNSENVDEAVSVVFGSYNITIAWSRFQAWEKVMLFGNGDASAEVDSQISVTVHHTYFDSTGRRHPQARFGRFDFYNNYLDDWHMYAPVGPPTWHESFGAQCEDDCQLLYEQNIFERHGHEYDRLSQANQATRCESGGSITDRGYYVVPETSVNLRFNVRCAEGEWERPYEAAVQSADEALRQTLLLEAGDTE